MQSSTAMEVTANKVGNMGTEMNSNTLDTPHGSNVASFEKEIRLAELLSAAQFSGSFPL